MQTDSNDSSINDPHCWLCKSLSELKLFCDEDQHGKYWTNELHSLYKDVLVLGLGRLHNKIITVI